MQNDPRNASSSREKTGRQARGGGVFIALGTIVGTIGGGLLGQPSAGLLIGLVSGIGVHGLLWYLDSRKG